MKKRTSEKQHLDQKQSKKGHRAIYNILIGICVLVILFAGYRLFTTLKDYRDAENVYDQTKQNYTKENASDNSAASTSDQSDTAWYNMINVDFKELQSYNPDVIGWIYIEGSDIINYPILYSGDDSSYLRTSIDKKHAIAGSIFLEGVNTPDFEDYHSIIYGHRMRYTMFGTLKNYKNEEGYYEAHPDIQILTPTVAYRYQIFSWSDVDANNYTYTVYYDHDEKYGQFLERIQADAMQKTGVEVSPEDKVITLSTCSKTSDRFVVHAKRVAAYVYSTGEELDETAANAYDSNPDLAPTRQN